MVYFSGLASIIECIYLEETLGDKIGSCKIFINPENITYLTGKIIVINELNYPLSHIETLARNNCKIISRIKVQSSNAEFQPYIIRPCFKIIWQGMTLEITTINEKIKEEILDCCSFISDKYELYFPKLIGEGVDQISKDSEGNLTAIGWALQQSGINILEKDTPFIDMDILKTKKMNF